ATVAVTVSANGGIVPAGSDLPRSLVVTAVLSFAAAAGIAWFLLDRRRKGSRRPMGSRRFRLGRNPWFRVSFLGGAKLDFTEPTSRNRPKLSPSVSTRSGTSDDKFQTAQPDEES